VKKVACVAWWFKQFEARAQKLEKLRIRTAKPQRTLPGSLQLRRNKVKITKGSNVADDAMIFCKIAVIL